MCLAIFKPKDILLTKATLEKSFDNNPDGAGFAYPAKDGKSMIVDRGYFGFRKFWRAYREVQKGQPMLIHFRIATSGCVDEANCHPFLIDKKHALIHNGNIADKLQEKSENVSDTSFFVETKLKPLFFDSKLKRKRFWASSPFKWLMEETIGGSKMVILDSSGFEMIYNMEFGEWEYGAWFSNDTYKKDRKSIRTATVTTEVHNGFVKEIIKYASGRTRSRIIKEDTSKAFVLKDREKENTHIEQGQEFLNEVNRHPIIDIAEMY